MKPNKPQKLRRPSASEVAAFLAPSDDSVSIPLRRPIYDHLNAQLDGCDAVTKWVNDRITAELLRLAHLTGGRGAAIMTPENRTKAMKTRWDEWHRTHARKPRGVDEPSVRVRAYDDAHAAFVALDANRLLRVERCGRIVTDALAYAGINTVSMFAYCESHVGKPRNFITVPRDAFDAAKSFCAAKKIAITKFVSWSLTR